MTMERILAEVRGFDGVLELAPEPGSAYPEISWGDHYFYYAPDGVVPTKRQPYATIVTKDYPDDVESRLGDPGRWRLNIHVGPKTAAELVAGATAGYDAEDVFLPHPLYGDYGWVCVVNPGAATLERALAALRDAHTEDRRRVERRQATTGQATTGQATTGQATTGENA
ncbi:DUF6194 family protein [Leifsonia shinshuensis]|uniref:DUF6194 domain-containing protein n=1 Tax=Leifsonia shinshuensis TaxID=150026 RepID=A0A853CZ38_9MICO|nr:DUF6194 family protein [Leifsonia shinshuensis]NYJ23765.1 hypothetical protein [Leifsonia shinshuensis]